RAIPIFERYGDEQGLARAWRLVADCHALKGRIGDLEEAALRVQEHAARAEDGQLHAAGIAYWVGAIAFGPRPVEEGIALLEEMRTQPMPVRRVEPLVLDELAVVRAMNGEVAQARELVARALALTVELGLTLAQVLVRDRVGYVELLAGD